MRTDGSRGTYEWWYFDGVLDDGARLLGTRCLVGLSHTGAEDVGLVARGAPDRAVTIGADVQMPGVVLARHRATDGALPAVTLASALRAHQRLRLCHRWITPSGSRDRRHAAGPSTRNPPPAPVQLLRAATMPRKETSAPTTKITTAR
jgi:hypothetical protein